MSNYPCVTGSDPTHHNMSVTAFPPTRTLDNGAIVEFASPVRYCRWCGKYFATPCEPEPADEPAVEVRAAMIVDADPTEDIFAEPGQRMLSRRGFAPFDPEEIEWYGCGDMVDDIPQTDAAWAGWLAGVIFWTGREHPVEEVSFEDEHPSEPDGEDAR